MVAEVLLFVLGLLLCVILGSNNASVCFGTSTGSNDTNYPLAAGMAALGVFLGMLLEGYKLSGVVFSSGLGEISVETMLIMLIVNLAMLLVATYFRIPLSLSHSLIGSVVGVGVGTRVPVNWSYILTVVLSWVLTPLVGILSAVLISMALIRVSHNIKNPLTLDYLYGRLTLILAFYTSYVLGANTIGLVTGLFVDYLGKQLIYSFIFGLAAAFGIFFLGRGLAEVVGQGIVELSPLTGLVAQFGGAFTVHLFTQFGLPVSITQALLGGVLGAGLAKKIGRAHV